MGIRWQGALASGMVLVLIAAGCSMAKPWKASATKNVDERQVKRDAALADFEERRTATQLAAAQDRVAMGEPDDARRLLQGILRRDPRCRDASLMLAVLHADNDDTAAAEQVLSAALKLTPNDAEMHHALGSILELDQRLPEAKAHFAQACHLAPGNSVFRESLDGLQGIAPAPLPTAFVKSEKAAKPERVAAHLSDGK